MTYHLPAAAQWLRTGTLGVFETWFYNPANTYSPLAGSIFIAWLIAPFHSDLAARFVEVGPLLMIFWAVLSLSRRRRGECACRNIDRRRRCTGQAVFEPCESDEG